MNKILRLLLFLLLFIFILPIPFLPLGRDQVGFSYYGMALSRGLWPYIDYYNINTHGLTFINYISYVIFGNSIPAMRIIEVFFLIASLYITYRIFTKILKNRFWPIALLYFLFSYISLGYYYMGERDCFVLFFLIFSLYFYIQSFIFPKKFHYGIFTGVCLSAVVFFRWTYSIFPAFLFIYMLLLVKRRKSLLFMILGFLIIPLIFISVYLVRFGTSFINSLYFNHVTLTNLTYEAIGGIHSFSITNAWGHLLYAIWWDFFSLILAVVLFIKRNGEFRRMSADATRKEFPIAGAILSFSLLVQIAYFVIAYLQGSFQYYHLLPLQYFSSIVTFTLAGLAVKKNIIALVVFTIIVLFSRGFTIQIGNIYKNYAMAKSTIEGKTYCPDSPGYCPADYRQVAGEIVKYSEKNDNIAVWGMDYDLYYFADRVSRLKFPTTFELWIKNKPEITELYKEYIKELKADPPKLYLVDTFRRDMGNEDQLDDNIDHYSELTTFLKDKYYMAEKVNNILIYKLK